MAGRGALKDKGKVYIYIYIYNICGSKRRRRLEIWRVQRTYGPAAVDSREKREKMY